MTGRRAFIAQLSGLVAGLSALTACNTENTAAEDSGKIIIDRPLLDAFVDTIVPKDDYAGAVEAGIPEQLLQRFNGKPEDKKNAYNLLNRIDEIAHGRFQGSYIKCSLEQREMILDIILKSRLEANKIARTTLYRLRSRIIKEFYSSAEAWEMLAFSAPYPAGYPDFDRPPPE